MSGSTHIVFIPGDVSIDPLEAVKKGLARLSRPRPARPRPRPGPYLQLARERLSGVGPAVRRTITNPVYPLRRRPAKIHERPRTKAKRIRRELLDAGASVYGLLKAESRYLPKILHDDEHIEAMIYGQHQSSSAMLLATNERILYLDKKPMAVLSDEVSYEVVSGIKFDVHTLFATVVLHTPVRNYDFRYVNLHCAEKFARYIESQRLERSEKEADDNGEAPPELPTFIEGEVSQYPIELKEDMAGYYWLPTEEEERRRVQEEGLI